MNYSLFISIGALFVSMISLWLSRKNWLESNRPIVTVRVTNQSGGNVSSTLNLLVENTGNRPAKNIRLSVDPEKFKSVFLVDDDEEIIGSSIKTCFSDRGVIPVLANGKFVTNSFGSINMSEDQEFWVKHSRLDVTVSYEDLDEKRKFKHTIPILLADDRGFAGGFWS